MHENSASNQIYVLLKTLLFPEFHDQRIYESALADAHMMLSGNVIFNGLHSDKMAIVGVVIKSHGKMVGHG